MKSKILFIACLLFGLMFINSGLNKFFNYMPVQEDMSEEQVALFSALMQLGWLLPLLAVVEIIAGILIIIPKFRALAAVMFVPIMIGILLTHITLGEGLAIPLVLAAILIWAIAENWSKYLPMIRA